MIKMLLTTLMVPILFLGIACLACPISHKTKYDPRIIKILGPAWRGTAFYLKATSGKVYLITNAHVCDNEPVLLNKSNGLYEIHPVIKIYKKADLCVLSTARVDKYFELGDRYYKGEHITVIGYPLGKRRVVHGILKSITYKYDEFYIIAKVAVDHGNSGSPVIDPQGKVIGVIGIGLFEQKLGGLVPLGYLKDLLRGM